ncbi:MAG: isoprenylcysteine carboxyl methyltransferase [Candidatus Bathyarchaeum sp.]|nr:MAG: isoprenylcysteine carboxyl methyltransferase [Candidatus Bathyarchaeum sp.]
MKLVDLLKLLVLVFVVSVCLFYISVAVYGWDNWGFALVNIAFFGVFVLFTQFRTKLARLPSSVYLAFIVALYAEMYGFPLTLYFFTWVFGVENVYTLEHLLAGVIGENLFASIFHVVLLPLSNIVMLVGIVLIVVGWRQIFNAKGDLVTTGIYAYTRNPQYLGMLLLTFGMNIQWLTILSLFLWPLLVVLYYRLSKEEAKVIEAKFGEKYRAYKEKVPLFIPRLRKKKLEK